MRRRVFVVLLAASLVSVFAGPALAKPLSKPEYIKAADNICRQSQILLDEVGQALYADVPNGQDPTPEQFDAIGPEVEPILTQEIDSLRALPAPKADAKKLKKLYKLVEKGYNEIIDNPSLLGGTEPPAVLKKASKKAAAYGFKVCGT
jgi:hypothetical protein